MALKFLIQIGSALLLVGPLHAAEPITDRQSYRDPRALELKKAVLAADLDTVRQLVSAVATNDCLEVDEEGRTALHYAVAECAAGGTDPKPMEILKLLAGRDACVNAADRSGGLAILGLVPLTWESRAKMDALAVLVANHANLNAQDENGTTLLHQLLATWNAAALHWPEVVRVLLDGKASPNIKNSAGQTPLHAFFGSAGFCSDRIGVRATTVSVAQKVFTMLADAGADMTVKDKDGTSPLGMMLLQDEPYLGTKQTILDFLNLSLSNRFRMNLAAIKQRPALVFVCDQARADSDLVHRMIELGSDAKAVEPDGFTALHGGAWFYNAAVCELLLKAGANVNAVNGKGRTPLHELARSTYISSPYLETDRGADLLATADVLVEHGADRRIKDHDGKTAADLLKVAPLSDDVELMRRLRRKLR